MKSTKEGGLICFTPQNLQLFLNVKLRSLILKPSLIREKPTGKETMRKGSKEEGRLWIFMPLNTVRFGLGPQIFKW